MITIKILGKLSTGDATAASSYCCNASRRIEKSSSAVQEVEETRRQGRVERRVTGEEAEGREVKIVEATSGVAEVGDLKNETREAE